MKDAKRCPVAACLYYLPLQTLYIWFPGDKTSDGVHCLALASYLLRDLGAHGAVRLTPLDQHSAYYKTRLHTTKHKFTRLHPTALRL